MILATVKCVSTLLTPLEHTFSREICWLFRIAKPEVASNHAHDPVVVAKEGTVLRKGTASSQIERAAVSISAVRRSAAGGEVLHKFGRRKEAGIHEKCPRFD